MRIFLRILVILVVLGVGAFFALNWWTKRAQAAIDAPVAVRVEPATKGELVETISASGEVEPRTKVAISAKISARILELPFKEGDKVTKGDPNANPPIPASLLVRLDAKDLESALRSAEARHAAQQAQYRVTEAQLDASRSRIKGTQVTLSEAQRDLRRKKKLFETHDVGEADVETAQSKVDELLQQIESANQALKAEAAGLEVLKHQIEAAEADIAKAKEDLSYTVISSPIDGIVTRLNAEVGEMVVTGTMNNAGTMIMEVADLSQMLLNARVDETAIADVQVGQKAKVRMEAYRDKTFEGTVVSVALANFDPQLSRGSGGRSFMQTNDGSKFFKVEILIKTEAKRIFSGLSADVDIETKHFSDIIKVPSQAVLARAPDTLPPQIRDLPEVDKTKAMVPVVYKYVDGKATVIPVNIGASDLTHTVIKSGVAVGDPIITGPFKVLESIQHDQKVKDDRPGGAMRPTTQPTTAPATTRP